MPDGGRARLRTAILADSLVVGGAERVVQTLALRLAEFDVDVELGCLREAGPIGEALRDAGVPIRTHLGPGRADLANVWRVRRWLGTAGADVLLALDHSNALFFGRLAARWRGLPSVVAVHRTRRADGSPSLGRIDRLLMPWTASVIAVSRGHAEYLRREEGIDETRLRVVYNGVDPARFATADEPSRREAERRSLGLPVDAPTVGIVAALRPEKNHEALLRILVREDLRDVRLVIVGDGTRRQELERRARDLGLTDRIVWAGWRDDVVGVLAAIDTLVLPSHPNVETFPLCVLEAMAAGRPAVATAVGSLDEMIVDGETGWLVPPGNDDALATALAEAARRPDERSRRGEAARRRLREHFDEAQMVEAVAGVLHETAR